MIKRFEVHSHTMYSNFRLLDCINKPKDLINRAIELGLSGIAITDHETIATAPEINLYAQEIQKVNPDFKVAIGNEIYLTGTRDKNQKYYHFILICKDKIGWRMLRELSSISWMQSYVDRGMERVPTLYSELENIINKYGKGHLIATSACIGGELSSTILELVKAEQTNATNINEIKGKIHAFMTFMHRLFGDDFYCEIAPGLSPEQIAVNNRMISIARAYEKKIVIGTDAHYLKKEDRYVHEAYLNSKDGEREVASFYEYAYLQPEEDIKKHLEPTNLIFEELAANSMEIYNKIENFTIQHKQQIPRVKVEAPVPYEDNSLNKFPIIKSMRMSKDVYERYWVNECLKKLKELDKDNDEYLARLEEEADVKRTIGEKLETNMFCYPVTLQHYINMFWECGSMVGAGRGSSCSGLNHYLLGVTQLDPIKWNLPFFRYLNKERIELGDIDLDLCPSKRPMIIEKIKEERGQNFNADVDDLSRQNLGCTLIATYGTESTKSAILTACRGYRGQGSGYTTTGVPSGHQEVITTYHNGIDVDIAQYLSSLIPVERGFVWPLEDVMYGNPDKDRQPVAAFVNEVNNYPGLIDIMLGIQGLIKQRGSHASGVIFFDEDPYEFGAFMKTPGGDVITQFDLHMCESLGMTKFDFLVTDVQDKLVETIRLLQEHGEIEKDLTLKEVYDKYFHPEVIPLDYDKAWKAIEDGSVINVFQFDSAVGAQAAKKIKPKTILELADANGLMRLMTAERGAEMPIDKYVRYKNDISLWYQEMRRCGLTPEEQKILEPYFLSSYGVPPSQEQLMTMLMDENICGFTLGEANSARKIVGKKQMAKIPELRDKVYRQAKSPALGRYVWQYGAGPQMGYSFSIIHALAYSFIGYQTAYIGTKFNPIYWNTACLTVNSGSVGGGSTNYVKMAKALGDIMSEGIKVSLVDINKSALGFEPDIENNQILFGLKSMLNVGDDVIERTISMRPYSSPKDYLEKVKPNKQAMISLIKGGAFDNMEDRKFLMAWYIWETCDKKKRITLQNVASLIKHNLLPEDTEQQVTARRIFEFNRYLKKVCIDSTKTYFNLDERGMNFLIEMEYEDLVTNGNKVLVKDWDKVYQKWMDIFREWISKNKDQILQNLNDKIFREDWEKYAKGSLSAWEMEVLCFYYHEHELAHLDMKKYGYSDFYQLTEEPIIVSSWKTKNGHTIVRYQLYTICGTCIAKDKIRSTVTLLTTDGVVDVKFRKEYFALFDKQISALGADGVKHVIEKSWFNRGNMIVVQGTRQGDNFIPRKYVNAGMAHQLYKICEISEDGENIKLQSTRAQGEYDEED